MYINGYDSPLGKITMASDGNALTGLWFEGQKHFPDLVDAAKADLPVFVQTCRWLDIYFSGGVPENRPVLQMAGTDFQRAVWTALLQIPYGQVVTYGALAARLGTAAARAVGSAVGRNPISLIVPCHRVIGTDGTLTGYAGGLDRKRQLLELEQISI